MGVPITFLHKWNPRQFEIVRFHRTTSAKTTRKTVW
ncbi:adenine-specific methyltransferase EcoRI family protein [Actinobaculum suis]